MEAAKRDLTYEFEVTCGVIWAVFAAECANIDSQIIFGEANTMKLQTERIYQYAQERMLGLIRLPLPDAYKGQDALRRLAERITQDGCRHVFIVCGKTVTKHGLVDGFLRELAGMGIRTTVWDGAIPNPTVANVEEGVAAYESTACYSLVVFGGGSSMDCGKLIAARVTNPGLSVPDMHGSMKLKRKPVPLYAVPTTAGTGSEATLAAVVIDEKDHHKYSVNDPRLIPRACALDARLTATVPPAVTGQTGMDALTHAVEACTNLYGLKNAYGYGKSAVCIILNCLEAAYDDGSVIKNREKMLTGSFKAGAAFTRNCVGYVHAIGHPLSGFYDLPHGQVMAALLPVIMRRYGNAVTEQLAGLFDAAADYQAAGSRRKESFLNTDRSGLSQAEKADLFLQEIERLDAKFAIPKHFDCIREEDILSMVAFAAAEAKGYPTPIIFSEDEIAEIYRGLMS